MTSLKRRRITRAWRPASSPRWRARSIGYQAGRRSQRRAGSGSAGIAAGGDGAPGLEVVDIFREHGAASRRADAGHVSLGQLKVMSAIERCRTAALDRGALCFHGRLWRRPCRALRGLRSRHTVVAFNSCRDRHCPKCQGGAARKWLAEREAELLEVGYFHLVFTLPAASPTSPGRTRRWSTACCSRPPPRPPHHRRRSQASRRQDRHHRRAP